MAAVTLIDVSSVPPGSGAEVVANGKIFAVYNVEGTIYVIDGICPHAGGPLGKGMLRGNIVTCPWHGWSYEIRTGRLVQDPKVGVSRHDVRIVDGDVQVRLTP